jgi:O-antigen/teichoic acid export membrane protein
MMRETLKRLTKMTAGYGMVQWAGPILSFIFTPIITRILAPADYGVADYVLSVSSAASILALFALPQALAAHFNNHPEIAWQRRITGSALTLALIFGAGAGLLIFILAPTIAQLSFGNQQYVHLFRLVGVAFVFGVSGAILTGAAQLALRVRWGMVFSLTSIICTVFGNIVFIVVLRLGAAGMLLTPILTGTVLSGVALVMTRQIIGPPARATMGLLLHSGALLLPASAATWALQMIDRFFLVNYVSTTELGYYAIANKIAGLLYVVMAPIYAAWTPLALAMQDDPQARDRYAIMSRYFVGIALAASLALSLFATEILLVMTRPAYVPAAPYAGVLAYVQVFSGIGTLLYTGALASKQLKTVSWVVMVGAGVNIFLNMALIPSFGLWGATIATVIGVAVPQGLLYVLLQRVYPIPYPIGKLLAALAVQVILVIVALHVPPLHFLIRLALKMAIFLLLPLAFVALGMITPFEMAHGRLFVVNQARRLWRSR